MSEVASAYVTLLPSAKGFGKRTESILNGDMSKTGDRLGKKISSGLGKGLKRTAAGVGIAVGGVIGAGLAKGFSRLKGIDQAESKLRGLGHSAKGVEKIMGNALTSVKGTAFGLDEAATTAATAVAAGIKPGKELADYLTLVGDAATISGTSMADMGRVMNKARTLGGAYNDTLQVLAERGLPVYSLLAKEMKVSTGEVKKLASEGKVSAEILENALRKNVGGAAKQSGKTFQGALANMQAALGRLGAKFLEGAFSKLPGLFSNITTWLDSMGPHVETAAAKMSELAGIGWDKLQAGVEALQPAAERAKELAGVTWGKLQSGIDALGRLKDFDLSNLDGKKIGTQLGTAISGALNSLVSLSSELTKKFGELMGKVDWVGIGVQIGKQVPAMMLGLAAGILAFDFGSLWNGIVNNWQTILIAALSLMFAPAKLIGPLAKILGKIPFVGTFLSRAVIWFNQLGSKLTGFLGDLFSTFWRAATGRARFPGAVLISKIMGALASIPGRVKNFFSLLGTRMGVWALDAVDWLGRGFRRGVPAFLGFVRSIPGRVFRAIGSMVRLLSPRGAEAMAGLLNGIKSRVSAVYGFLKSIPGRIKAAFSGAANWLVSAGRDIINGLKNGINGAIDSAVAAAKNAASRIKNAVTGFFKIKSPSRVMAQQGEYISQGLAKGIEKGAPKAVKAAREMAKKSLEAVKKQIEGFKSLRAAVKDAFAPDLFSGSLGEFVVGLRTQKLGNQAVIAAIRKLKGMNINPRFLSGLIQSGNTELITALAGAGAGTVRSTQADWLAVQRSAAQIGTTTAETVTGRKLDSLERELKRLNKAVARLPKETGREVSKGVNGSASNGRRNRR